MNENIKEEIKEMETNTEIKTIDENYDNLKAVITALTQDYEKFKSKKVKAAGQRVRNGLLNTKKLCDTLRKQVLADIREIPIKHRSKSSSDEEGEVKSDEVKSEEEVKEQSDPSGKEEHTFVKNFNEHVMKPLSEREVMEASGELPPVITKPKRKRRANKVKEVKAE